jgi:hypothetical protein
VDVVGIAAAGHTDVELFGVGSFVDDEVGFIDRGALCAVDGGCVVDGEVAGCDVVSGDGVTVSVVEVGEIQLVLGAGVDGPSVTVAHPLLVA